jgi:hypothetical protein
MYWESRREEPPVTIHDVDATRRTKGDIEELHKRVSAKTTLYLHRAEAAHCPQILPDAHLPQVHAK